MSLIQMINSLSWIIINAASDGYVSSNDVDFANECLDKIQSRPTQRAGDSASPVANRVSHPEWIDAKRVRPAKTPSA